MISEKEYISQVYKDTQGYISRMYIDNQKFGTYTYHYSPDNLAELPVIDEENLYLSQNTFFRPVRNKDSLKKLNMLYIDLDCYKVGLRKEYVFQLLSDEYIGSKIPRPTYIIDSGRGLYLLWRINEDRNAFPRWKRVQHYLHETLKDLGSDSSVTEDTARVLRVPGSINSKTGTKVEILNECKYTYTLYEIIKEYLPEKYKCSKEAPQHKKYGNLINIKSLNTLFYARIKDIETLLLMRDKTQSVELRENSLFMYRYCCCHYYNDTAKALQLTLELFRKLSDQSGYTERDIKRLTKSGETYYLKRNRKFTNRKIIELLDIKAEEQDKLITLISKEKARERKSMHDKEAYKKKLEAQGKDTKGQAIEQRRKRIKELFEANKSVETICTLLNISKATFYRDLEVIRKEDSLIIEPKKNKETEIPKNKKTALKMTTELQKVQNNSNKKNNSQKFHSCITKDVVLYTIPEIVKAVPPSLVIPFSSSQPDSLLYIGPVSESPGHF